LKQLQFAVGIGVESSMKQPGVLPDEHWAQQLRTASPLQSPAAQW
jgi:hypothetical protein